MFIDYDFNEKNVSFKITDNDARAVIDYDTIRLAIYYCRTLPSILLRILYWLLRYIPTTMGLG